MKSPKFIAGMVFAALFIVFLIQNTQVVTLRLYFWKISMSQIILIPLVLILGFLLGYLVCKLAGRRRTPKRHEVVENKR